MKTIAQPINLVDLAAAKPLRVSSATIEICDLTHHYGCDKGGLDRLNLTIKPGEKVGLVGCSGVGKSTILKLLLRFYDVESGKIVIDGQNISHVTQDSLRRQTGMVQQDSSLLHLLVRDNIRYSR
jgi:ATP-binding cassette subfamily B multidrug efflux pump